MQELKIGRPEMVSHPTSGPTPGRVWTRGDGLACCQSMMRQPISSQVHDRLRRHLRRFTTVKMKRIALALDCLARQALAWSFARTEDDGGGRCK